MRRTGAARWIRLPRRRDRSGAFAHGTGSAQVTLDNMKRPPADAFCPFTVC